MFLNSLFKHSVSVSICVFRKNQKQGYKFIMVSIVLQILSVTHPVKLISGDSYNILVVFLVINIHYKLMRNHFSHPFSHLWEYLKSESIKKTFCYHFPPPPASHFLTLSILCKLTKYLFYFYLMRFDFHILRKSISSSTVLQLTH